MISGRNVHPWLAREPTRSGSARLAAPRVQADGDDANWWIITLSDLTLLIVGFAVIWYVASRSASALPADPARMSQAVTVERAALRASPLPEETVPWQSVQRQIESFVAAAKLTDDVTVESAPHEIILSLRDTVPFASGKADLRPQALPILEKIAAIVLSNSQLSVEISGHTDSLRIATVEFPSNWELSAARASRVARYLVERGVPPRRISVQGYADLRPRNSNATALSRRANRRVEIRLFHDAGAAKTAPPDAASR